VIIVVVSNNMNWDDIRIFLAYARQGTIKAASEELRISAATVSRRLAVLQSNLERPLFKHGKHGIELVQSAKPMLEMWQEAEVLLQNADGVASRMGDAKRVELRFSTTPALAAALIFPNVNGFLDKWENVSLDIETSFRVVDIGAGQGDIALRYTEPERGNVIRQKVGKLPFSVFASNTIVPAYLECANSWEELRETGMRAITWTPGASVSMPQEKLRTAMAGSKPAVSISEFSGLVEAIRSGLGVGILPDIVGLRLPDVRRISTAELVGSMPLWLVTAERLARYPHVVAFRNFIRSTVENSTAGDGVTSA
jgi:DNA-binding transcriptional LysR family regulator